MIVFGFKRPRRPSASSGPSPAFRPPSDPSLPSPTPSSASAPPAPGSRATPSADPGRATSCASTSARRNILASSLVSFPPVFHSVGAGVERGTSGEFRVAETGPVARGCERHHGVKRAIGSTSHRRFRTLLRGTNPDWPSRGSRTTTTGPSTPRR